ncbi:unnamed protein product [Aphanomyces euteiches]
MEHHTVRLSSGDEEAIHKSLLKQVQIAVLTSPAMRLMNATREGFDLQEQHRGVRVYARKSASGGNETMSVSYSHLPFENIMYLLLAQSTEEHRIQQTLFFDDAFLDGCVLNTILTPTEEDPFQWYGIKYTRMVMSSYSFVDPRDMCYVEISGTTVDIDGNSVLYVMRESLTLQDVPDVPNAIRCRIKSLSLHTECPNGTIEHCQFHYLNPFGTVPSFVFNSSRFRHSTVIERYGQLINFKRMLELSKRTSFFPASQNACGSCSRVFWALTSRHACRSCCEVVCSKCCILIPRPKAQLYQANLTIIKEEYCKTCYLQVRDSSSSSGVATSLLSSRYLPKDSEPSLGFRSPVGTVQSRRSYKTPSSKQATLSMIPPLRG